MKLTDIYKKLQEQNEVTGKIWIKDIKNFNKSGFGFFGSTFNYKDIFNDITKKHLNGNKDDRFYWDKTHKCWWTASDTSRDEAKKLFSDKLGGHWNQNNFEFKYNKNEFDIKNNAASPTLNKELENLRALWSKTTAGYATDISDLQANKAYACPGCGVPIVKNQMKSMRDGEGEVTHWKYDCHNCHTKLTLFND
jgi:DNA-directed RNA polymerase subunit RPC12/RpoP